MCVAGKGVAGRQQCINNRGKKSGRQKEGREGKKAKAKARQGKKKCLKISMHGSGSPGPCPRQKHMMKIKAKQFSLLDDEGGRHNF